MRIEDMITQDDTNNMILQHILLTNSIENVLG